jgi:hypothetical protein
LGAHGFDAGPRDPIRLPIGRTDHPPTPQPGEQAWRAVGEDLTIMGEARHVRDFAALVKDVPDASATCEHVENALLEL